MKVFTLVVIMNEAFRIPYVVKVYLLLISYFLKKTINGLAIFRSSHQRCFMKKGVLKNFAKFTEKHLYQSLLFNKAANLRPATLVKKRLWHRCFLIDFAKFLRISFFIEQLWWLLQHNLMILFCFVATFPYHLKKLSHDLRMIFW